MTKAEWKPIRGSKNTPDHIMLSVNGSADSTMTVTWRTDVKIDSGYALFRKKNSADLWQKAEAEKNRFETDVDDSNYFFAHMAGLEADTEYEYTCGNDEYRSGVYSFRSARKNFDKFSFLCLSDVQTGGSNPPADYTELGEIVKKILSEHPEIEFILTAGDNTNCGQTDVQWTGLFDGLKGIIESIPLMLCMGNHDDMGFSDYFLLTDKYYSEKATYFSNQLKGSYADNGPEDWKVTNYSFDYGNAHFAVMGTSGFEYINEWLVADMDSSDKTWKFGAHHFPVCYSGPDLECEDTYPALRDGMEKCDVIFSGHEHSFARSFPRRMDNLYDRPSEGTIHYNIGSGNRNPPGTRVVPKVWNSVTYEHEEDLSMFSVVDIDKNKCTLTSYVEDGRIVDMCVIDKDEDRIYPYMCAPKYNKTRIKYKGYDLGLCVSETLAENKDGVWCVPLAALIKFIGGTAVLSEGAVRGEVYGRFAEFRVGALTADTDRGVISLPAPCYIGAKGQIYVPCDALSAFRMHWTYFERNNFISIESETEEKPVPVQK